LLQPAKHFVSFVVAGVVLCTHLSGQVSDQAEDRPQNQPVRSTRSAAPRSRTTPYIAVQNVVAVHDQQGAGIEITSTVAVVPSITKLDGPPRLVIDLPGTMNRVSRSRIVPVQAGDIKTIQVSQLQQDPPVTRISVDLKEARSYSWEAANDKLVVYLRPAEPPAEKAKADPAQIETAKAEPTPPSVTVPAFTQGVAPAITTAATGGAVGLVLAGNPVGRGSTVSAASETAILNLSRGGSIRVCPGTTISVTTSQNGQQLMLGMSTGSLETHYSLASSQDAILTPDFRIALPGPGDFAYAFSADAKGNTCVRSLPGNTASAVVSELMGNGTYQVKPNEEVVFRNGQLAKTDSVVPLDCGCPAAQAPVVRAEASRQPVAPAEALIAGSTSNTTPPTADDPSLIPPVASLAEMVPGPAASRTSYSMAKADTGPEPNSSNKPMHIQIEAPLVFRGDQLPPPPPTREAGKLPAVSATRSAGIANSTVPAAAQPPKTQPKESTGFFHKVRHFFSSMFG
jgi:AMIN domain-containing protein